MDGENAFKKLLELTETLHSPDGCDWDKEQTVSSYAKFVKEETEEFLEAIESGDTAHMREEMGDAIWSLIFFAKLCEKEQLFSLDAALREVHEKIVRRHPHVFGDVEVSSVQEIMDNWQTIKREEKDKKDS